MTLTASRTDRIYAVLSGDDSDERSCKAIPEDACTSVPRNFLLNLANGCASKLAEQLAGPNLVLPVMLASIGAPVYLIALLMPIKQAGSLIPQLAVARQIRAFRLRKWFWTGAGSVQSLCLVLMALALVSAPPHLAGPWIVFLLLVFSVASGVGSVAFQDVMGKTIPKGRRGRLLSGRAAIGGVLTLAAGLVLNLERGETVPVSLFLALLLGAAALWAAAAIAFALADETPGATSGGRSMLSELVSGMALVRDSRTYRRYLCARAGLLAAEVALPFYALYIANAAGSGSDVLGTLIISVAVANIVSSPIWGALSDRSGRVAMALSGALSVMTGLLLLALGAFSEALPHWLYGLPFLLGGIAEAGVRVSRKTYLVDIAPEADRPLYTAFSNTLAGGIALASGLLGVLASMAGVHVAIAALIGFALSGALVALTLPEAEENDPGEDPAAA
ncbi:MAG TPA: MFS transporter [Gammaproteobacteria bacterium]|nr:MFS transporter [Gammaproteobacteria bacterium]